MTESSRSQGVLICVGAVTAGLVFALGLLSGSWWAVAIPVAVLLAFVLGLAFWVGYTIATVQVEPEVDPGSQGADPAPAPPVGEGADAPR